MTLDTPERVKYFGLRNVRSCGICRLRAGRSSARTSTRHDPNEIKNLYQVATTEVGTRSNILRRKRARDTLQRHGFDYKKRCRLTDYVRHSGVQINNFGNELFFGLVRYERMHVYFIAYCTYCLELLAQCVPKKNCGIVHSIVTECHQFRDPSTGITHPRLQSVLNMNHLTAERRVRALFYWGHVLGPQEDVIVEDCRQPCQVAVATLQVLLIATRGHRAYSSKELDVIFLQVGTQFFRNLELISAYLERKRCRRLQSLHRRDPNRHQAPIPFKGTERYIHVYTHFPHVYTRASPTYTRASPTYTRVSLPRIHALLPRIHALPHVYTHLSPTYIRTSNHTSLGMITSPTRHRRTTISHGAESAKWKTVKRDYCTQSCMQANLSNEEGITVLSAQLPLKQATNIT